MEISLSRELAGWLQQQLAAGMAIPEIRAALISRGAAPEAAIDRLCVNLRDNGFKLTQAIARHDGALQPVVLDAVPRVDTRAPQRQAAEPFAPLHPLPGADANRIEIDGRDIEVLATLASPHAVVLDGVLDSRECRQLIATSQGRLKRALVVDSERGGDRVDERRTSELVSYARGETPWLAEIERRIARLTGIPLEHGEGLQVMRYGPGAEYQPHFDHFDVAQPGQAEHLAYGGQRVATLVIYLNEVEAGGATVFPEAGFSVVPARGRALYFAYTDAEGRCDPRAFHGGAPVEQGEKWIVTRWFRQRPYQTLA